MKKIFIIIGFIIVVSSSLGGWFYNEQKASNLKTEEDTIFIHRFDKKVLTLLNETDTLQAKKIESRIEKSDSAMLFLISKALFNQSVNDKEIHWSQLYNYFGEPTLLNLYNQAIQKYNDIAEIEKKLNHTLISLKKVLPEIPMPSVYMHVSGLNQNVITDGKILSLSIDKYMGSDYPLYQDFFYPYQLLKMQPQNILPDYLRAWLMIQYPFEENERILLDRMIYEGKILYLQLLTIPQITPEILLGYTTQQLEWCKKHQHKLWVYIVQQKHLFTPDEKVTDRYFTERPCTFINEDAPGNLGSWIGYQIVKSYIQNNDITETQLLHIKSQDVLTHSKYKP